MSWMVDRISTQIEDKPWCGVMSLPMELKLATVNGMYSIEVLPIDEIKDSRGELVVEKEDVSLGEELVIEDVEENLYDLQGEINVGTATEITVTFASNDNCETKLIFDVVNQTVTLDMSKSGQLVNTVVKASLVPVDGIIDLRLIMDISVVELYFNNGQQNIQSFIFPEGGSTKIIISASGGEATLNSLEIWALSSIHDKEE